MARPVGWLGRLDSITKTVANSVRSHYDRADLTALFDLKERSMFALMAALPKVHVGRSVLVERASLLAFLERLRAAEDPAAEIARVRTETPATPRRKMREFRVTEVAGKLDELPNNITLNTGELHIRFRNMEELGLSMAALAEVLRHDLDNFALRYEPHPERSPEKEAESQAAREEADYFKNWQPGMD
jgi:hypothetical protein